VDPLLDEDPSNDKLPSGSPFDAASSPDLPSNEDSSSGERRIGEGGRRRRGAGRVMMEGRKKDFRKIMFSTNIYNAEGHVSSELLGTAGSSLFNRPDITCS
jgi:hypothetical protein